MQVIQRQNRRRRSGFRQLFILYFWGILLTTFLASCVIELIIAIFIITSNERELHILALQIVIFLFISAVPCVLLIIVTLMFARLMGSKISQPVNELMLAVKKIRQQDLDFSIHYQEQNELGELCSAFNELRRELQEALEREWRKQEEMRTMIAALSHDLRTPVTIIQGYIESLVRAEAGEKRNQRLERYLPVLESSSQRMTRLLTDMLLVASLEEASFVIEPQPVQLTEAFERKAAIYQLQAATHDIAFSYGHTLANGTGPVLLDLHRLEQVLDNLFENALRSTPAHGQIRLTCTQQPDRLLFLLRDTGCGITPADLPHVFEKFYHGQARPGEKARKASGLGLSTCKLLVERHGGTIALQNHPAGGCEVAFCLPLNAAHGSFADGNEGDES
jgi:two-component system, OmpR family, lantibiotic biosynthesis sensor histidine kinase NisK/SpaK